jgi:hypothetical protein
MTVLPPLLVRIPVIFYVAALLFGVASFGLTLLELESTRQFAPSHDPVVRLTLLRGLYQALLEASYLAANGVLAHILLAIWADGRSERRGGGQA